MSLSKRDKALAKLKADISALFGAASDAVHHECTYAVRWREDDGDHAEAYVVYANGGVKPEGESTRVVDSFENAIASTFVAVRDAYRTARAQRIIWRRDPSYEEWPAKHASKAFPARPAGFAISLRIVAIPLNAKTINPAMEDA